jgi:hypothetical protein
VIITADSLADSANSSFPTLTLDQAATDLKVHEAQIRAEERVPDLDWAKRKLT